MSNDIKIGSTVQLLYWKHNEVVEGEVIDIFFERYLFDYKTRVKVKFYVKSFDCWVLETYYVNDFFEAMNKAKEITDNKEAEE